MLTFILVAALCFGVSNPTFAAQISGFVWLDSNGDGLQDNSEIGFAKTIPNFGAPKVELYDENYAVVGLAALNESSQGRYRFDNLAAGIYHLCISAIYRKIDLFVTQRNVGTDDTVDSDFFPSSSCVLEDIILADQQEAVYDMGLAGDGTLSGGSISGIIGHDGNQNFLFEENERVMTVVTIKAGSFDRNVEKRGMFQRHTVSDSTGHYEFTDLPTGIYNISCVDCGTNGRTTKSYST